eukprot:2831484-Pleurochrysis_carterae.AAC.1
MGAGAVSSQRRLRRVAVFRSSMCGGARVDAGILDDGLLSCYRATLAIVREKPLAAVIAADGKWLAQVAARGREYMEWEWEWGAGRLARQRKRRVVDAFCVTG